MSVETLEAWQLGMKLVEMIYDVTSRFPREEKYNLITQLRRAANSIPSNLAEGDGRASRRDYARFVSHSQGSAAEVRTQLLIAERLGYMQMTPELVDLIDHISRKLNRLRRSLLRPKTRMTDDG